MSETITITIDDQDYEVQAGARLIDVISDVTTQEVPRFCYHRDLSVVGSCRMCQVEIEAPAPGGVMRRALAISCRTPVAKDMKVWTQSSAAQKARKGVLEFLLKDHPLDCPICDKAGECPLQNFTYQEGQAEGRSHDPRRKRRKRVSLGDVIVLDEERCVLCTRCVRFFPEVEGQDQLQVLELGNRSVIGTFDDRPLQGDYQGNLADICPVGALTLSKFRFRARVWNTRSVPTSCTRCSRGCSIMMDAYRGDVVRIRPRYDAEVNKSWMCDYGRFSFDDLNVPGRLATALRSTDGVLENIGLEGGIQTAATWLREASQDAFIVASPFLTQEEAKPLYAFTKELQCEAWFLAPNQKEGDGVLKTGDPCPNRYGLLELGFKAITPEDLLKRAKTAPAVFLAGEKILQILFGIDPSTPHPELPYPEISARSILLDTHPRDGFGLYLPAKTWAEKHGHVLNVDGIRRVLRPVLSGPENILDGADLLGQMVQQLQISDTASQPLRV